MKSLILGIVLTVSLFIPTGTATAQHHGHSDYSYSHGARHGYAHGQSLHHGVGVYSYPAPFYGGGYYSPGCSTGMYASPGYYAPRLGIPTSHSYGGGYVGQSHGHYRHHRHHY